MRRTVTTIAAYREGPLLVRGPMRLIDEDGDEIEVRRRVVPLCRCGRSRQKPLCDGSHAATGRARIADATIAETTRLSVADLPGT
jgi:CDGSH-type Zn-finger protein